jgi:hypothetical protein
MVRRDDQEGAGFLSHPVRRGNNGIRAPTQPTAIYTLAAPSTPVPIKDAVVARLEAGERLEGAEVQALVREAKAAEKQAREEARLTPRQHKTRAQRRAAQERHQQAWERDERKREVMAHGVAQFLAAKLRS